jgi:NTE family protein
MAIQHGSRTLVLGGGGSTGVAWLVGVNAGFADAGIDLRTADRFIGTSAGSIIGSRLAAGQSADAMVGDVLNRMDSVIENAAMGALDLNELLAIMGEWETLPDNSPESCQRIAKMALDATVLDEATFLSLLGRETPTEWPAGNLVATAVDAESGERVLLDRSSGMTLLQAIACSICVPGIFPPVSVGGRRYVDGGLFSATHAEQAAGAEQVLVFAPIGSRPDGMDPNALAQLEGEVAELRAAGSSVTTLLPDAQANDVIGINRMDAALGDVVMAEGRRQGAALAASLVGTW